MNIALLYAAHEAEGDFSTPKGWHQELVSRGHIVKHFNLYHNNGFAKNKQGHHIYSSEGLNQLINEYRNGIFQPDILYILDYGVFDCIYLNKQTFPDILLVAELGDLPQSFKNHQSKYGKFDLYFGPCYQSIEYLKQYGNKAFWQTHFADTRWFYPRNHIKKENIVTTTCGPRGCGKLKGLTEKLEQEFGEQFLNKRYFYGLDHGDFLAKGKINLQCSQYGEITRRIFECMAMSNLVITDKLGDHTHINDLFVEDKDIVYYSSIEECIEKIKYYLDHDKEREQIALNGYNKVIENHTISNRVDEWLNIIENHLMEHN